ncbi:Ser/Thr protein phosphatase superfamily protein [Nannizzia gypsea CBS 118893]|uniref:Ser/Thr protein phosphatase superfamily protein n=1 Tax=Arthroderma gypseum (strain ATCC MYA-4604 / CBS 118893) TaxID=535722 RepID=E4V2A6_ARTGP|nr:Ser/Thr protein phosphatase superfamily protein [Nannizzia gypsea CBS 118893]EFR04171.1 Ser/Thr protein phosphatase superfamily protein [Nannizzia gypsea CBS 118893]
MSPRIQVLSDLHLEVNNEYRTFSIPVAAPFLVLAGDIGQLIDYEDYLHFLSVQCTQFQHVYLVLGNHEFYGLSRQDGLKLAARLEQEAQLHGKLSILNRTRAELPGSPNIILLGCTLQSRIPPESVDAVSGRVRDFQRILNWSIANHNAEHTRDTEWLADQIKSINDEKKDATIMIITHHAPCIRESSRPDQVDNPWTCSFATELFDKAAVFSQVQFWVFGHTHYTTSFVKEGVRLVSNQRGYPHTGSAVAKGASMSSHDFDVNRTITLD